jgi:hypothetical protein
MGFFIEKLSALSVGFVVLGSGVALHARLGWLALLPLGEIAEMVQLEGVYLPWALHWLCRLGQPPSLYLQQRFRSDSGEMDRVGWPLPGLPPCWPPLP